MTTIKCTANKLLLFPLLLLLCPIIVSVVRSQDPQVELTTREKECFADFLVFRRNLPVISSSRRNQQQSDDESADFVIPNGNFPFAVEMGEWLKDAETRHFLLKCIDDTYKRLLIVQKIVENGKKRLAKIYEKILELNEIAPSAKAQAKLHNAQCLLDLGVLEGKINVYPSEMRKFIFNSDSKWFQEIAASHRPDIPIDEIDNALIVWQCLIQGAGFGARVKVEENGLNMLQLADAERDKLLAVLQLIPCSDRLLEQIGKEMGCVADFLVLSMFVRTEIFVAKIAGRYRQEFDHFLRWRRIAREEVEKMEDRIYANAQNQRHFSMMQLCIQHRRELILPKDEVGNPFLDVKRIYELSHGHLVVSEPLTQTLDRQSDCLTSFLALTSEHFSVTKISRLGPAHGRVSTAYAPNIVNLGDPNDAFLLWLSNWSLEPKKCVFAEGSPEFKQLFECGATMTTTTEGPSSGSEVLDVSRLLGLYDRQHLFLPGILVEMLILKPSHGSVDEKCPICFEKDEPAADNRKSVFLSCKHKFHRECLQPWIKAHDTCPLCREVVEFHLHHQIVGIDAKM